MTSTGVTIESYKANRRAYLKDLKRKGLKEPKGKFKKVKPLKPVDPENPERNSRYYPTDHSLDIAVETIAQKHHDLSVTVDEQRLAIRNLQLTIKQLIEAVSLLTKQKRAKK